MNRFWRNAGTWIRPTVWFFAAYTINQVFHETTHAATAYFLGLPSTLFNYHVSPDLTHATLNERALIGSAGPLFSLAVGVLCLFAYRRSKGTVAELPLLYCSAFGLCMFFGNIMSAGFVGDFSNAANALSVPVWMRFLATLIGLFSSAAVLFWVGRQLRQWIPAGEDPMIGVIRVIALPVLAGTAAVILVNQPMPELFIGARAGEASFWIFAGLGACMPTRDSLKAGGSVGLRWVDIGITIIVVVLVRLMVPGISLNP
jgi:hypothetical protein